MPKKKELIQNCNMEVKRDMKWKVITSAIPRNAGAAETHLLSDVLHDAVAKDRKRAEVYKEDIRLLDHLEEQLYQLVALNAPEKLILNHLSIVRNHTQKLLERI